MPSVNRTILNKSRTISYNCDDVYATVYNNNLFIGFINHPSQRSIKCVEAVIKKAKQRDGIGEAYLSSGVVDFDGEVPLSHRSNAQRHLLAQGKITLELALEVGTIHPSGSDSLHTVK